MRKAFVVSEKNWRMRQKMTESFFFSPDGGERVRRERLKIAECGNYHIVWSCFLPNAAKNVLSPKWDRTEMYESAINAKVSAKFFTCQPKKSAASGNFWTKSLIWEFVDKKFLDKWPTRQKNTSVRQYVHVRRQKKNVCGSENLVGKAAAVNRTSSMARGSAYRAGRHFFCERWERCH